MIKPCLLKPQLGFRHQWTIRHPGSCGQAYITDDCAEEELPAQPSSALWGLLFAHVTQSSDSIPGASSAWKGIYTACASQATHRLARSGWFSYTRAVWGYGLLCWQLRVRWLRLRPALSVRFTISIEKRPTKHCSKTSGVRAIFGQVGYLRNNVLTHSARTCAHTQTHTHNLWKKLGSHILKIKRS